MKLRTLLTAVMMAVGALAISASVALVVLTSALHDAGRRIATAVERVRLVMELESRVLQGMQQPADRRIDVSHILDELRRGADAELTRDVDRLDDMIAALAGPVRGSHPEAALSNVVASLRAVAEREEIEAAQAVDAAAQFNATANRAGAAAIIALLIGMAAVLVWLWQRAFRPLLGVADAIQRVARGDPNVTAPERGPDEVKTIAVAFNNMSASLGRQRQQQLAFIGGVAHDLRTPLNALRVGVSLFERKPEDAQRIAEKVVRQVDRMDRMVADLLDGSRIEAGRLELRLEIRDLRDIVARVVELHQDANPDRGFPLSMPDSPVPVRCDTGRLEQVLNNLLSNAIKYSPDASDVLVVVSTRGGEALIDVTDRGIGIQPADLSNVFQPFSRGGNVGAIGGVGLGLSVSRRIAEAHGGRITVRSTPGAGSTFTVALPLARQPGAPPPRLETAGHARQA